MYPQTILDDIKDRVSIAALIGERVSLKKAGRNFKGCCPFHSEKTPSFMVSEEKKIYHCFGCGEGGNIFNFFMKFDGLSFLEAVEALAARAGVSLPKAKTVDKKQEDLLEKKKKWAYRLNELVAEHFMGNLKDGGKGLAARNYLKSRDILPEKTAQHFLGYADDSWESLVRFLTARKAPLDLAAEIGVLKRRDGGGYYDFFRHRVMFPVVTPQGKVIAFSGRTFGEAKTAEGREPPAKYLNSPDSVIYHKSHTVYGLNVAFDAVRKEDAVVLVEGNLDAVRLHQEGIKNAVAPLGTALTSGHLRLLSRYTKNFFVVFDGDEAGIKAAVRSLPLFLEAGLIPKVVALETGEDPDSFVRKNGAAAFKKLMETPPSLFEWVMDVTAAKFGDATDGKVKTVEELKPLFKLVTNPVEAAIYRKKLATRLAIEEAVLASSLTSRSLAGLAERPPAKTGMKTAEHALVELMLAYPETVLAVRGQLELSLFEDGACQTIAKLVFDEFDKTGKLDVESLSEGIADEGLRSQILSLALDEEKYDDPLSAVKDCVAKIKGLAAKKRLTELSGIVQREADAGRLAGYMNEMRMITKELHSLGIKGAP